MAIASTRPATAFTYREVTHQDRLREVARELPQKPALIAGDRVMSYADLDAASDHIAAALAKRAIRELAQRSPRKRASPSRRRCGSPR